MEYLRAIKKLAPQLKPITVKRVGSSYKDYEISDIMSAGAIRKFFYKRGRFISVPENILSIYKREQENGRIFNESAFKNFIHKYILLADPKDFEDIYDVLPGMEYFILNAAQKSKNGEEFFNALTTKSYTHSRLRRVLLYMMLKTKNIESLPTYTTLLGANSYGRLVVKNAKKLEKINILTKIANYNKLDSVSIKQVEESLKIDAVRSAFTDTPSPKSNIFKQNPFLCK